MAKNKQPIPWNENKQILKDIEAVRVAIKADTRTTAVDFRLTCSGDFVVGTALVKDAEGRYLAKRYVTYMGSPSSVELCGIRSTDIDKVRVSIMDAIKNETQFVPEWIPANA